MRLIPQYSGKTPEQWLIEFVQDCWNKFLFHSTDARNGFSIEKHGLLSRKEMLARDIAPAYPGGSDIMRSIETTRGLDDYVFLSFTRDRLMPKHHDARFRQPRTIRIDPEILGQRGVKITLGRAYRLDTRKWNVARAVPEMHWDIITGNCDADDIRNRPRIATVWDYEVLVQGCVPVEWMVRVE